MNLQRRECLKSFLIVLGCYLGIWAVGIVAAHIESTSTSIAFSIKTVWFEILWKLGIIFVPLLLRVVYLCVKNSSSA